MCSGAPRVARFLSPPLDKFWGQRLLSDYVKMEWWQGSPSQWCPVEWYGRLKNLSIHHPDICETIHYWSTKGKARISQSIVRRNNRRDHRWSEGWSKNHPKVPSFVRTAVRSQRCSYGWRSSKRMLTKDY